MDWIERTFGVSPDFGNGADERIIVILIVVAAGFFVSRVLWHRLTGKHRNQAISDPSGRESDGRV
jgi:hypothetical protein